MKRPVIVILLILNVLRLCGQGVPVNDSLNPPSPPNMDEFIVREGEEFFRLYRDSKITVLKNMAGGYVHIDKGNKIVFHYYNRNIHWDFITDENYEEEAYFEFNPNLLNQSFSADSLRSAKAFYSWRCFCDWPDSNQVEIRKGYIKLDYLSDFKWEIDISFISELNHDTLKIDTVLSYFEGGYAQANSDTINRLDYRGKRIGYWEEETKYRRKYGYYQNDENFTGVEIEYYYKTKSKVLSEISYFVMDTESERIRFNENGMIIQHCKLVNKKDLICDDKK